MSDVITATLSRQSGLLRDLSIIANNVANASTDGFKREASIFAEFVEGRSGEPSISMGSLRAHYTDYAQGTMKPTGGTFDLAIEGEGFFAIERGGETYLTRAGLFQLNEEGFIVNPDGDTLLDEGGSEIVIPPGTTDIAVARDGTVTADDFGVGAVGVFSADGDRMMRMGANLWKSEEKPEALENPSIRQGFIEASNVSAVTEMARLIETQRLYDAGASMERDDHERVTQMIEALAGR